MTLNHVRVTLFDQSRQALDRGMLGFWKFLRIDNDQLFPAAAVRERDAHDMIYLAF